MDYLPLFCQLRNKHCLLVGGGDVAERKARLLLDAGAILTVNALTFNATFLDWGQRGRVTLLMRPFTPSLLDDVWLAVAATDDATVNQWVADNATQRRVFCNVVDSPDIASAIMPSLVNRSPLMIAISSGGKAPVLARLLREKLESLLPLHLGALAQLAGTLRQRVKSQFPRAGTRRRFWEKLFAHDRLAHTLARNDATHCTMLVEQLFQTPVTDRGEVVLVGAGPGDAGLLTLKGLQQLQQADVLVYDRLVSDDVINLARRDAERIFVGKQAGNHSLPQEQINQLLCDHARAGKRVVRLKGGDPLIFGRGGEELEYLRRAGIPCSVVPGITAASGCAAASGIPLTHRDHAQGLRFITGHARHEQTLDWASLAAEKQTLVFYMGLTQARYIQQKLMQQGLPATTPVALIEKGTTAEQKVFIGQLSALVTLAQQVTSPSLMIIGSVVSLCDTSCTTSLQPKSNQAEHSSAVEGDCVAIMFNQE